MKVKLVMAYSFSRMQKENKKVQDSFYGLLQIFVFFSLLPVKEKEKKEVIQQQVPLRLPCDDLTLLAELRFEPIENRTSSKPCSGGLTGGVCKEQGHIHRAMLTPDY